MTACAHFESPPEPRARSLEWESQKAQGLVQDHRAEFRQVLCATRGEASCQETLRPLADEILPAKADPDGPAPMSQHAAATAHRNYRIAFVSGLFAECLNPEDWPFADTHKALSHDGYAAHYWPVGGRASVPRNAEKIRQYLQKLPPDPRPWIVVAYSKGLPDVLHMLSLGPLPQGQSIAGILSIAGASGGSILADRHEQLYRLTLRWLPIGPCEAGSGDEMHDLQTPVRQAWWAQTGAALIAQKTLPPIWALVGAPQSDRVSPVLSLSHREIAAVDPLNDGQLRLSDALTPGARLLGVVNADHWGMGMALGRHHLWLRPALKDEVDREGLIRSAIEVISRHAPTRP